MIQSNIKLLVILSAMTFLLSCSSENGQSTDIEPVGDSPFQELYNQGVH